ncbi:bacteriohemerythrin [Rhodobium gokarnense]|uniref:Hemerythrin-like metal-binding protein n=1 Tax=Rhodobium gokarnense TaxID=364296 RepID=A0ABT3H7V7_9HYPH|nr:hemerythrin family protein [Rhodobium gokarnense]MCW2306475.1 hemerythrin-like metal-binding protein [Rhodobium gokarnense]
MVAKPPSSMAASIAVATGDAIIDADHVAFEVLIDEAAAADDARLGAALKRLRRHLVEHFEQEDVMMAETRFPAAGFHRGDHEKVLARIDRAIADNAGGNPRAVRTFLEDELPVWFVGHVATLDAVTVHWARTGVLGF